MPRVLHLIDSFDLGGAQTVLLDLVRHLPAQGFEIEVAAMHGRGVFCSTFEELGVRTHSLSRSKVPPNYLFRLPVLLARKRFDILHTHLFGSIWIGVPIAALLRIPVRIVHDHCNDAKRHKSRFTLYIDSLVNRLAHATLAVSKSTCDFLLTHEGLVQEQVHLVYNGVCTQTFAPPSPSERSDARASFGIAPEEFVIGGVGRFVKQKNFSVLLDAVAALIPKTPHLRLLLAGEGPLESELRSQAMRLGINERVIFAGFVRNRVALYHALDCLALPSLFEGLPMALLEAMASGCPVVASKVDGMAEILTSGHNGLLFSLTEPGALRDTLAYIIHDKALRCSLACAARSFVLKSFSAATQAARVAEIYRKELAKIKAFTC